MKEYDLIVIGTGSAMNIVDAMLRDNPKMKVAVIDKDEPGGICLTRGCIPSKILLYPSELVRLVEKANELGVQTEINRIEFSKIMQRMRRLIDEDIEAIREGLSTSENIDYYPNAAEFVAPYTLKAGKETIRSKMIFLCTGSQTIIPRVSGLEEAGYLTSDTVFRLRELPESFVIVGGGYIAAEFGHFFATMGSRVTILGRNSRFLPEEEPEVSALAKRELGRHMTILTNHEVTEAGRAPGGQKRVVGVNSGNGQRVEITATQILVAVGRGPTSDILHPERAGIATDEKGWLKVDDYLESTQPNVWVIGDADGRYPFKHVANYESEVVYYNAVLKQKTRVDYHAIPHAVFTYPEIASVGLKEDEAVREFGKKEVLVGFYKYEDTAKGEAMAVKDYFVKVLIHRSSNKILGAHIIGPYASILIQEIINLMYTEEQSASIMLRAIHIHPALNETVQRAFQSLTTVDAYHHVLEHQLGLRI